MNIENREKTFTLIKDQYFMIDNNYDSLFNACTTKDEKRILKRNYMASRTNYRKSLNLIFDENDPVINELTNELSKLEERIKNDIKKKRKALNVMKMISDAVKIASNIIIMITNLS